MALQKCHECGKDVSSEAKSCPNCGAIVKTLEILPKKTNKPSGGLIFIGIVIFISLFIAASQTCQQNANIRKEEELAAEYQKKLIQEEESSKKYFINEIEYYYGMLDKY